MNVADAILNRDPAARLVSELRCPCRGLLAAVYRWQGSRWLWLPAQPGWHLGDRYFTSEHARALDDGQEWSGITCCPRCGAGRLLGTVELPHAGTVLRRVGLHGFAENGDRWRVDGEPELVVPGLCSD